MAKTFEYPEALRIESGCKVCWRYYAKKREANAAAEVAKAHAEARAAQGYDFGYQTPGQITAANGLYIVVCP
jgi:hypothetical protein